MRHQTWVNTAVFEVERDGQTLVEILQKRGFESRVYFDKLLQMFLFLCPPRATFRVQVRSNDFKRVVEFMNTAPEPEPVLEHAIHCPSCGSLRVNYPQMTRKFFIPTIILNLGIIFRVIEHEAYCDACHHTWNLPKSSSPHLTKSPKPAH